MIDAVPSGKLNLAEIKEIDIFVVRRFRELTGGDHKSVFKGGGFDFIGLRDWQPGDKLSSVDWPQSSLNNYDPLIVREFEEDKNGTIFLVVDASLSMYCGTNGLLSRDIAARTIATIGLSGVFFQDLTGLFIFNHQFRYGYARPRMGKNNVISCINRYLNPEFSHQARNSLDVIRKISGHLKRTSMVPVISDFLFDDSSNFISCLANIKSRHDLFIIMIDCSFLFDLPDVSSGWIECLDSENGRKTILSRNEFRKMSQRVIGYQNDMVDKIKKSGIEVIITGPDKNEFYNNMTEFFFNRRTKRKVSL